MFKVTLLRANGTSSQFEAPTLVEFAKRTLAEIYERTRMERTPIVRVFLADAKNRSASYLMEYTLHEIGEELENGGWAKCDAMAGRTAEVRS